jgi:hypothetical protein
METPPGEGAEKDTSEKPSNDEKPKNEKAKEKDLGPPTEKVFPIDPVINREYTTFYAQQEPATLAAVFYDKSAGVWR